MADVLPGPYQGETREHAEARWASYKLADQFEARDETTKRVNTKLQTCPVCLAKNKRLIWTYYWKAGWVCSVYCGYIGTWKWIQSWRHKKRQERRKSK